MHWFLLLSFFIVSGGVFSLEDMSKCTKFMQPDGLSCCKKLSNLLENTKENEECLKLPMIPPACEAQKCFAKKAGFSLDDNKVNKDELTKSFENRFKNDQDFLNKLKENCIIGDLDNYGPPGICEIVKIKTCIHVTAMKECPEWDSKDECSGAEEAAKDCINFFT